MAADAIIVVSGPPRAGTSLMMNMLGAAGVPLLVDGVRAPDEDNPLGYFEYERVRSLARNNAWLELARGKAVKVIYRLLRHLPVDNAYRVLFMERAAEEVIRSQNALLRRQGLVELASDDVDESMRAMEAELQEARDWLAGQAHCTVLPVSHQTLLHDPVPLLQDVCRFLKLPDESQLMAARINRSLHRQRAAL